MSVFNHRLLRLFFVFDDSALRAPPGTRETVGNLCYPHLRQTKGARATLLTGSRIGIEGKKMGSANRRKLVQSSFVGNQGEQGNSIYAFQFSGAGERKHGVYSSRKVGNCTRG